MHLRVIDSEYLPVMSLGCSWLSLIEQDQPQQQVGQHAQRRIGLSLSQTEQALCEVGRRLKIPSTPIIQTQPPKRRDQLRVSPRCSHNSRTRA